MATLNFNEEHLEEAAEAWWRSLSPDIRGVYLQAAWEVNGCPEPEAREPKRPTKSMRAMKPAEWERQVRELCAASIRGKAKYNDIRAIERLRAINVERFDQISEEERTRAQAEVNPFGLPIRVKA